MYFATMDVPQPVPIPLSRVAGVFTKPGVVSNTLLLRMDNSRDPLSDTHFSGPSRHSFDLPFGETHFLNLLRPLWLVQVRRHTLLFVACANPTLCVAFVSSV
jgi:hypothetical protein